MPTHSRVRVPSVSRLIHETEPTTSHVPGTCLPLSLHPALKLGLRTQYYPGQTGAILSTSSSILCSAVCPCPAYAKMLNRRQKERAKRQIKSQTLLRQSLHLPPRKAPFHISPSLVPSIHSQANTQQSSNTICTATSKVSKVTRQNTPASQTALS